MRLMDVIFGRKFKTSKFKATVNLAVSRLAILKNHRQARLAVAHSDIIQLLNLNHHEQALLRVDQVIKEQNMLDVYVMLDGYCHLLVQMINLIEQHKECPDELKEAVSSLIFAAPRCGEFPELKEIRAILTAHYGKDFAYGATELRSNCGVNPRMIPKLSTRQSGLEARMKMLQEIAMENNIVLKLDDSSPLVKEGGFVVEHKQNQPTSGEIGNDFNVSGDEFVEVSKFSGSRERKKKFRDVEDAAQAAFESAKYAAAAARAAVELSRSRSFGSDNPDSPNSRPRKVTDLKSNLQMRHEQSSESEPESEPEHEYEREVTNVEVESKILEDYTKEADGYEPSGKRVVFDKSDNEIENLTSDFSSLKMQQQLDLTKRPISVRTKRVYGR